MSRYLTEKLCKGCDKTLPREAFYTKPNHGKKRDTISMMCRPCMTGYNYDKDKRRTQSGGKREDGLRNKYGITLAQYDEMLKAQGGTCLGCLKTPQEVGGNLCVDHDHRCCEGTKTCGKCVRGLLCNPCNRALGNINDSRTTLHNLDQYLATHEAA